MSGDSARAARLVAEVRSGMQGYSEGDVRAVAGYLADATDELLANEPAADKPWLEPKWLILTELRRHRYDYDNKGAEPTDPGWHVCSCGSWEGYWCDFQPHVAERIDAELTHPRTRSFHDA